MKIVLGLASASRFWPRPWPRPQRFVLGLGLGLEKMSSFNVTARSVYQQLAPIFAVSGGGPEQRKSAKLYGPYGLGRTLLLLFAHTTQLN